MLIAGVDEVGRGALASEVLAEAVILPADYDLPGLNDSKKLTAKARERLVPLIRAQALGWAIGRASVAEIDRLNIHHATLLAMQRAVAGLILSPELVLVDGKFTPALPMAARALVGGDGREPAIGAASILAKVQRDAEMTAAAGSYPAYGFERHKGYGTAQHLAALAALGPCPLHRSSFAPVRQGRLF